jgi:predicted phosphodiesterase
MRIIGDVHGKHEAYLDLISNRKTSIQVGDFGFNYSVLDCVDSNNHKIIGGNHDNYDIINNYPHFLGDFGTFENDGISFFFVRGERSVDAHLRTEGVTWWKDEELSTQQGYAAVDAYEKCKPNVVISHGCPAELIPHFVTNPAKQMYPSKTSQILDSMWSVHKPKFWIFGHHHNSKSVLISDCFCCCLDELECLDI